MKKLLLLALLSASCFAAEVYHCSLFSEKDFATDVTKIHDPALPIGFVNEDKKEVQLGIDKKFYHFYYVETRGDIKVYENKAKTTVLGVFKDFKNGVRVITPEYSFDIVDCVKDTKIK